MIKVKARILTDVEMVLDTDIDDRNNKRKMLEHLAKQGYSNVELKQINSERLEDVEEIDLDFDLADLGHMYGKMYP